MWYVYLHIDPIKNKVFYVGKGKNRRAYSLSNRNKYHKRIVSKIKEKGLTPIIQIVKMFETENDAFDYEKFLIKKYRDEGIKLTNFTDGGEGLSGHEFSEEHKRKMSKAATGRKYKKEEIEKYSESAKKRCTEAWKEKMKKYHIKKVYCPQVDRVYNSLVEAANFLNVSEHSVWAICSGRNKMTKGNLTFEYYNPQLEISKEDK